MSGMPRSEKTNESGNNRHSDNLDRSECSSLPELTSSEGEDNESINDHPNSGMIAIVKKVFEKQPSTLYDSCIQAYLKALDIVNSDTASLDKVKELCGSWDSTKYEMLKKVESLNGLFTAGKFGESIKTELREGVTLSQHICLYPS
ncbi:hypothetical protein TREMEDRAFT_58270 [Tremella mesenterica DSM 1558]|uniref:uncharacterized protein n=1 Tax=Tremella mesenterica (strain ATCC 24925 / CBS 8224 / DSM 1558 / NBRC 9311 / NRRL Y-6157 / RJB 2259-6 / UBC 559-6) TaxID=578456 RepID=UPI0003F491B7|nr:uncharacterized protein TREMEDRAFT_58270 [Tremella mesenterica DSM 1558]EIW72116.1 hypothetical protein TREMEDRAFT_58270 [Tremella mesenterica DSM 1558]